MGLLAKLKSVLGLNGTGSGSSGRGSTGDVDVTVERQPATGSESAVKGTEPAGGVDTSSRSDEWFDDDSSADDDGPTADTADVIEEAESDDSGSDLGSPSASAGGTTGTDAAGSATEPSTTDEEPGVDESADDRDAASASDDADETGSTDADASSVEADDAEADAAVDQDSTDPVTEISGIGPAYGERLENAGVETVAELAARDADELSDETDVAQGRVEGWIESAKEY